MTTETPAAAAGTETPAPANSSTPSQPSQGQQQSSATQSEEVDLVTGAENQPAPKEEAPKAPETAAEKRAYLEGKEGADKEALKGKTDEEIEKLFNDDKAKEAEAAELGDFAFDKIKVPEDMPIPEELKGKVTDLAKVFNNKELSASEKMQKAIDMHVEQQQKQLDDFKKVKDEWRGKVLADPELKASVGAANDVVRKFAGDAKQLEEFQGALKFLGLGNHPAFVRFCANVAKATSEDSMDGKARDGGAKKDLASMMYPNMPQN
jgi:hypothetical protein